MNWLYFKFIFSHVRKVEHILSLHEVYTHYDICKLPEKCHYVNKYFFLEC